MEPRITLLTLGVDDLKRSEAFYSNTFGWKKSPDSNENIVFYKLNNFLFSLYPKEKLAKDAKTAITGTGYSRTAMAHNLNSEKAVDELFKKMKDKGVKVIKEPEKVFWGGYSGYISDPDGFLWEIAFNPFLKTDEMGNVL